MVNTFVTRPPRWESNLTAITKRFFAFLALLSIATFIALTSLFWLLVTLAIIVGSLLALVHPWLAWLGLAFALPISSGMRIGPASVTDLLLVASVALWLLSNVSQQDANGRRGHLLPHMSSQIPIWPLVLYLTALYLSTLGALVFDEALTEMVKWIEFGALLLVLPLAMPVRYLPWLVAVLLTAAALQGVYGLYQFIFRIGPEWFLIQGRFMRASGVFGQPNPYGAYLGLSLPVAFSLSLWGITSLLQRRRLHTVLWTLFYVVASLCIAIGLIASWSRGAWLGTIGGLAIVLALFDKRTALLFGTGLFTLTVSALVGAVNPGWIPPALAARLGAIPEYLGFGNVLTLEVTDENFAVVERVAHWVAALRMWESAPWLGVGPGNYAASYASVALPRWSDPLGHAHNVYLNVLGETGILGLITFLLLWVMLVGWLLRQCRKFKPGGLNEHSWSRALTVGVLGVLAYLAIHSQFDNLFVQGIYLHIGLWLATIAACTREPTFFRLKSSTSNDSESDG